MGKADGYQHKVDLTTANELAVGLQRLLRATNTALDEHSPASELIGKVTGHLRTTLQHIVVVSQSFDAWEHANLQRGVDAYLAERGGGHEWFGVAGGQRNHEELISMLATAHKHGMYELGAVDYGTAAIGPEETTEVVQLGLVPTQAPDGTPVIVGVRGPNPQHGPAQTCRLEVLSAHRPATTETRDRIEAMMRQHDVLRGQVLAFGSSEHRGNELLTFLPRPRLTEDQVVLPDGVLSEIEEHTAGVAAHSERLLAAGQHLKRGLLLHGPPGSGKTHTVRFLMGRLPESTVLILTGSALRSIGKAAALARRLQPSLVVIEDVDLIAQDRAMTPGGNPLLFTLLDAMDGVGSDADVTFVLTTNRAEELERALADRPGRVDLAVEIPKPDAEGRRRLLELYGREVDLRADLDPVIDQTEGTTASFAKELLRRAVLLVLSGDPGTGRVVVDDATLSAALTEMTDSRNALTRSLLGGRSSG